MQYDAIYLSPHLDDVALSCGGQVFDLTAKGKSVLVVTIMAGDPPGGAELSALAQALHARWDLATEVVARRRKEDGVACGVLGADYAHWHFLDCIYRRHPQTAEFLYTANDGLFGQVHEGETAVLSDLVTQMRALPAAGRVFAPLAVGNHVDHQLVRAAAEASLGTDLFYYEEFPYVRLSGALEMVVPQGSKAWVPKVTSVSAAGVQARIEAISAFASQVGSFFTGRADLEAQIHAQIATVGGERVWQHRSVA